MQSCRYSCFHSNRFSLQLSQSGWDRFARFIEYRDQLRGAAKPNLFVQVFSGAKRNFGPNGVTLQFGEFDSDLRIRQLFTIALS
jgi:hypothetical protein